MMQVHKFYTILLAGLLLAGCASRPTTEDVNDKHMVAARANTQLGIEYLRRGKLDLARDRIEKALAEEPDYADAHNVAALLYERVGELDLAEKHFRRGLRLKPDNPDAINNYAQFLCSRKRFDEAEKEFNEAAAQPFYKTPYLPLLNAGICMATVPDLAKAEQYYRAALEKRADFPPALLRMAQLNFDRGNYLGARAYLQRFHQAGAKTAESLWLAVQTEYALGDHQAWGNYAITLQNKFPESKQAHLLLEWENERRSGN